MVVTVNDKATGTIYTAAATVNAGKTVAYSLSGTDAARFSLNPATGALAFVSPPDYTAPADANADNEYLVTLTASDGSLSTSMALSVQVAKGVASGQAYSWTNATWGGGGYVSGLVYHPKVANLLYARTDVGGAYRWNATTKTWIALNDDLGRDDSQLTGILSIALDPNDANKLYLAAGQYLPSWGRTAAILRSSDQGATWSRTELPIRLGGNSDGRGEGERLQVDPNKGSILLLGTNQDGLWSSSDSGVSWSQVSGFTPSATTFVLFDARSGTNGHASQVIYVGVASTTGTSLYRSADGGANWASVPGEPTGLIPQHAAMDANGNLFVTYGNALGPNSITTGGVYRLNTTSGLWSDVTPMVPTTNLPFGYSGVSVDAQHPGTLVVSTIDRWNTGDDIYRSTDYGATWTGLNAKSSHSAPNNPWLTAYSGGSLAGKMGHWITDVAIDPFNGDNIAYNTGYGLWMSNNLSASGTVNWAFNDAGLEETVITSVLSPNAGAHLLMTQGDVAGGRYTSLTTGDVDGYFTDPNTTGDSVDVAELAPGLVVRTSSTDFGGYISNDNGVTWSHLAGSPVASGNGPGKIAVSALGTSLVWTPANQGAYYSTNNGMSWTASSGYPSASGQTYAVVADRAANGYFYGYNYTNGTLVESADGGKTFTTIISGLPTNAGSSMISIPGIKRRDLWIATSDGLYHIDGQAASVVKLTSVTEAYDIGYGAPAPGADYYALYLWGKVNGVVGLFRSDDTGANWTRINDANHQFGWINDLSGDPRVYGRVYLGTGGRGVIVGNR